MCNEDVNQQEWDKLQFDSGQTFAESGGEATVFAVGSDNGPYSAGNTAQYRSPRSTCLLLIRLSGGGEFPLEPKWPVQYLHGPDLD